MFQPGDRIASRFTVLRELGTGGMGTVFEVREDSTSSRMALKVLAPKFTAYRSIVARFHQEARFQAELTHPGITRVLELIDDDEVLGILMEFVEAPTLRDVMDEGRIAPGLARQITLELLSILAAVHEAGIAHRDMKPENIFVIGRGDATRCKLADFGVAKMLTPAEGEQGLTRGNTFLGTPRYASPEQVEHSASIDGRSDLYSLGVIVWEMLSGEEPYDDLDTPRQLQLAVLDRPLPPLPASIPDDLEDLVDALTKKERDDRPASARHAMTILHANVPVVPLTQWIRRPSPGDPPDSVPAHTGNPRSAKATFAFDLNDPLLERPSPPTPAKRPPSPTPEPAPQPPETASPAPRRRLKTAGLGGRLLGRLLDEFLLQLLVLSCIGIVVYPFAAMLRGAVGRWSSTGTAVLGLQVVDHRTGRPATTAQMLLRNFVDLVLFQLALAVTLWPVGWLYLIPPIVGLVWLVLFGWIDIAMALVHPKGRRIADFVAGTRVVKELEPR